MRAATPPGRKRCAATQACFQTSRSAAGQSHGGKARIFSAMGLLLGELGWCLILRQIGDHLAEQARRLGRLEADVEVPGGGDAAMAEHTADKLVIARIGFCDLLCFDFGLFSGAKSEASELVLIERKGTGASLRKSLFRVEHRAMPLASKKFWGPLLAVLFLRPSRILPAENQRLTAGGRFALTWQVPASQVGQGNLRAQKTGGGQDHRGHRGHGVGFDPSSGPMTPMRPMPSAIPPEMSFGSPCEELLEVPRSYRLVAPARAPSERSFDGLRCRRHS